MLLWGSTQQATAQGFYLRAGGGYSIEAAKSEFNDADPNDLTGIQQSTDITVNSNGATTIESLNGTVGEGYKINLTGGYMFNPYIGVELGINYFHGDETLIGRLNSPEVQSEEIAYIRGFDISPAVILTPGYEGVNPYARVGLLMTAAGDLTIETSAYQPNGAAPGTDIEVNAESEVTSKFSIGYVGALGVLVPVNDRISLFGEAEFKSFSIQSDEAEIKEFETMAIQDGQRVPVPGQQLEDLPVAEKEFRFEDEFTITGENPDEPRPIPRQYVNASGLGLNVGIRYNFGY